MWDCCFQRCFSGMFPLGNGMKDSRPLEKPPLCKQPQQLDCCPHSKYLRSASCMLDAGLVSKTQLSRCFVSLYLMGRGEQKMK